MKKVLVLVAALLGLAACSLPMGSGNNSNSNNNNNNPNGNINNQDDVNDAAIKILNLITLFPEVGDKVDFSEYVTFDPGYGHTLSEYTLKSNDNSIVSVEGYKVTCLNQGHANVEISGPGIKKKTEFSIYVGSVAGTYVPDSKRIANKISFTMEDVNENREGKCHLTVLDGTYNKSNLHPFDGDGTYFKNGTPIVNVSFPEEAPKDFVSISAILASYGVSFPSSFEVLDNSFIWMDYDPEFGVYLKVLLMGNLEYFYQA